MPALAHAAANCVFALAVTGLKYVRGAEADGPREPPDDIKRRINAIMGAENITYGSENGSVIIESDRMFLIELQSR